MRLLLKRPFSDHVILLYSITWVWGLYWWQKVRRIHSFAINVLSVLERCGCCHAFIYIYIYKHRKRPKITITFLSYTTALFFFIEKNIKWLQNDRLWENCSKWHQGVIAESVYILYSSITMNGTYNVQYGGIVNAFWIKALIANWSVILLLQLPLETLIPIETGSHTPCHEGRNRLGQSKMFSIRVKKCIYVKVHARFYLKYYLYASLSVSV